MDEYSIEQRETWETKLVDSVTEQTQLLGIAGRETLLHMRRQRHLRRGMRERGSPKRRAALAVTLAVTRKTTNTDALQFQ